MTGLVGYAPAYGANNYVTLCDYFFSNICSSMLCNQPGTLNPHPPTTVAEWQQPYMQAGIAASLENIQIGGDRLHVCTFN